MTFGHNAERQIIAVEDTDEKIGRGGFPAWTEREIETLTRMYNEGASFAEIRAVLERRTIDATRTKASQLGLNTRDCKEWSDDELKTLRDMWAEGHSGREIAAVLPGRGRCAVLGKIGRLKLQRGIGPGRSGRPRPPRERRPRIPRVLFKTIKPPRSYTVQPEYIPVDPIRFLDRRMDQCAFIAGDPRMGARAPEIQCCGAPTVGGTSWCSRHLRMISMPAPKRDRRSDNGRPASRFMEFA